MLDSAGVRLRPITQADRHTWRRVRQANAGWLGPWDATAPASSGAQPRSFAAMVRTMRREARAGRQAEREARKHRKAAKQRKRNGT